MYEYNVRQAQEEYARTIKTFKQDRNEPEEGQQAICFAKILIRQTVYPKEGVVFCRDNELFLSKTPAGYDVVGYFIDASGAKRPFSVSVCKINGLWYPAKQYVAPDTKSCSASILLWILLSIGCTLMGILMYYLISVSIGI